jgi:hypothetical protein
LWYFDKTIPVLRPLSIPVISEDRSGLGWTQLHSGGFGTAYIAEVPESLLVRKGSKKGSEKKLVKVSLEGMPYFGPLM